MRGWPASILRKRPDRLRTAHSGRRSHPGTSSTPPPFPSKNRIQTLVGLGLGPYPRLIHPYGTLAAPAALNLYHSKLASGAAGCVKQPTLRDSTVVLQPSGRGERNASSDLLPLVYKELRRLAAARMAQEAPGQTLQPTALVHEAWLRLVGNGNRTWQNRDHFFGTAAKAMRRILIESARRKSRIKRGGGMHRLDIEEVDLEAATPDDKVLLIDEALEELEAEDPEKAKIVVMKFFGGMTNQEVAANMGVTERTIERRWAYAKAWLFQKIQSQA